MRSTGVGIIHKININNKWQGTCGDDVNGDESYSEKENI